MTTIYEKVMSDIMKENKYLRLKQIETYVNENGDKFSSEQSENLKEAIDEKLTHFNPQDCSQVENIYLSYSSMPDEYRAMGIQAAQSACVQAHDLGYSLPDYLYEIYDTLRDFEVKKRTATEYDREFLRGIGLATPEMRRERRVSMQEAVDPNEVRVEYDIPYLMDNLKNDLIEYFEAQTHNDKGEMDRLQTAITKIQDQVNNTVKKVEKPQDQVNNTVKKVEKPQAREIYHNLDSSQYQYFLKNAHVLHIPFSIEKIERGRYNVTFTINEDEQEKRLSEFFSHVQEHKREPALPKERSAEFERVLDILCERWTKLTGEPCGLSRTGAFTGLAHRLVEFARQQPDSFVLKDKLDAMDIFAPTQLQIRQNPKMRIYTTEQADEAFSSFLVQNHAQRFEEEQEEDDCNGEMLADSIFNYDVYSTVIHKLGDKSRELISDREMKTYNNDIALMKKCGNYPNNLEPLRNDNTNIASSYGEYRPYDTRVREEVESTLLRMQGRAG
jgi:hypothetical protein